MSDYLAPTSGYAADILHRNHVAALARGPWRFRGLKAAEWKTERDSEGGESTYQATSGTCDCCGSPIVDVAVWLSASGERMTLGLDCSASFVRNMDKAMQATHDASEAARRRTKAKAAKVRKTARTITGNAALLARLDLMAVREGFAGQFARSVAAQVRNGKRPSEKQLALVTKLESEQTP